MAKKEWPLAHIEMYADGRTHLSFENDTPQTSTMSAVIKTKDVIKECVVQALGDKLQPGRVYCIMITRFRPFRNSIEFNYNRVR